MTQSNPKSFTHRATPFTLKVTELADEQAVTDAICADALPLNLSYDALLRISLLKLAPVLLKRKKRGMC